MSTAIAEVETPRKAHVYPNNYHAYWRYVVTHGRNDCWIWAQRGVLSVIYAVDDEQVMYEYQRFAIDPVVGYQAALLRTMVMIGRLFMRTSDQTEITMRLEDRLPVLGFARMPWGPETWDPANQ